jgi:hypothetical protein
VSPDEKTLAIVINRGEQAVLVPFDAVLVPRPGADDAPKK